MIPPNLVLCPYTDVEHSRSYSRLQVLDFGERCHEQLAQKGTRQDFHNMSVKETEQALKLDHNHGSSVSMAHWKLEQAKITIRLPSSSDEDIRLRKVG